MKKIIYSLAVMALLITVSPVMAEENTSPTPTLYGEAASTTAKMVKAKKYVRRYAVVTGELKEVRGTVAPTELVITLASVAPRKSQKWNGAYPEVKKDIVIKVDSKTKFVRKYWGLSNLGELTVGDKMHITGRTNEDGTFSANVVKDESLHATLKVKLGTVESINVASSTFILKQNGVNTTVIVGEKTKLVVNGIEKAVLSDLKVGDKVHVRGIINTKTKILTANLVRVVPLKTVATPVSTTTTAQ